MIKLSNITCRKAKLNDLKDILCMTYDFYKEFVLDKPENFKEEFIAQQVQTIVNNPDAEIMLVQNGQVNPIGMFFVYLAPAYYNPEKKVVEAHHLYLKPEFRNSSAVKVMLTAIRQWARNKKTFWLRDRLKEDKISYSIYKGESWQTQYQPQSSEA